MASNKDLKAEAKDLGEDLGIPIDFKGMKNEDLVELVSDLKAKIKDRDTVTQADEFVDGWVESEERMASSGPAAEEPMTIPAYRIAPGKALTTKRGILSEGQELSARDVCGGQATIDMRVESGHIVKE